MRRAGAIVALVGVVVGLAWLVRTSLPSSSRMKPEAPAAPPAAPLATTRANGNEAPSLRASAPSSAVAPAPSTSSSSPSPSRAPSAQKPIALALGSPRQTIATEQRLLEARDDDAFRSTFLPEVRAELTSEAIESCRKRLVGKTLKPDWDVAEESVEPGEAGMHRVVRVSIFGKSMTGFHEVAPDVWLADAAWCVPVF